MTLLGDGSMCFHSLVHIHGGCHLPGLICIFCLTSLRFSHLGLQERVDKLTTHLSRILTQYTTLGKEQFEVKMAGEAKSLSEAQFGEAILNTIG